MFEHSNSNTCSQAVYLQKSPRQLILVLHITLYSTCTMKPLACSISSFGILHSLVIMILLSDRSKVITGSG